MIRKSTNFLGPMSYTHRIFSIVVHFTSFKRILFILNIASIVLFFMYIINYSPLDLQRVSAVRPYSDAPDTYASSIPTN
jgi:hypothetical protein